MASSRFLYIVIVVSAFYLLGTVDARSLPKSLQRKGIKGDDEVELIAGFITFREINGVIEYILLQKEGEPDDWSPPKGHVDPLPGGDGYENPLDAAKREMFEETGLEPKDYNIYLEFPYKFNYTTNAGIQKEVHLWPAKLRNGSQPIVLDPHEHTDYLWLSFQAARVIIKKQYRQALIDTNVFIESLKE